MSEEIALAIADLKAVQELWDALDVALKQIDAEHNLTKALLIKMRHYFISHELQTGECVAWMHLKQRYGIGESTEADDQWLTAYQQAQRST
jgi:hypothetical protein